MQDGKLNLCNRGRVYGQDNVLTFVVDCVRDGEALSDAY